MAYYIRYALEVCWLPDGAGPMTVASAQKLRLGTLDFADLTTRTNIPAGQPTGFIAVPGGDSPTLANFNTALAGGTPTATTNMANDLSSAISTNLTRIQGFSTGGG